MNNIMKNKTFTIIAFVMAFIYWFVEGTIHYLIYKEPYFEYIPSDFHELWMRIVIVFLIVLFGIFADSFIRKIVHKQLEVAHTYSSMIYASRHILNNLLNQMQLFKLEALKTKDFDRDIIKLYDNSIKEASDLIDTLSKIEVIPDANKQ